MTGKNYYEIFRKKDHANSHSYDEYKALEKTVIVYEGTADEMILVPIEYRDVYVCACVGKQDLEDWEYDVSGVTNEDMHELAYDIWNYLVRDEAYQMALDQAACGFGLKKLYEEDDDEYYYVNEETENE